MENMEENEKVICTCTGVTYGAIKDAVQNGADSLAEVQDETGAGTICGACLEEIELLVDKFSKAR